MTLHQVSTVPRFLKRTVQGTTGLAKHGFSGFSLNKRQRIVVAALVLSLTVLLSTQTVNFIFFKYRLIIALGVVSYFLSLWALWEGMSRMRAFILLILPTLFTVAAISFYFLLPVRWLTRVPMAVIFGLGFYGLLLSQNVFNVAAERTIPLYRAAVTAAYIYTLVTAFLLFNVVFALNLPFYWNGVVVAAITFPLILQSLWTVEMQLGTTLLIYALVLSLLVGEGAVALSFWPVAPTVWSIFLSSIIYILTGVVSEMLKSRLTQRTILEYIGVAAVIILVSFTGTSWG